MTPIFDARAWAGLRAGLLARWPDHAFQSTDHLLNDVRRSTRPPQGPSLRTKPDERAAASGRSGASSPAGTRVC